MTATKPGPHVCEVTAVRPITSETSGTDGVRNTYTKNLTPLDEWLASDDGKAWLAERGINRDKTLGELVAWLDADPWQHVQIGDDGPPVSTDPTEWCGHDCLGDPCNRSADQPHTHHLVTGPDGRVFAVHETLSVITEATR